MNVYQQSLVPNFSQLSDKELTKLSMESECAHRAIMKGMYAIGSLMVSASAELGEDEIKNHFVALGDLMMHLPRYSEALFENAGNADYELKRRDKHKANAHKDELHEIAKLIDRLDKAMQR